MAFLVCQGYWFIHHFISLPLPALCQQETDCGSRKRWWVAWFCDGIGRVWMGFVEFEYVWMICENEWVKVSGPLLASSVTLTLLSTAPCDLLHREQAWRHFHLISPTPRKADLQSVHSKKTPLSIDFQWRSTMCLSEQSIHIKATSKVVNPIKSNQNTFI